MGLAGSDRGRRVEPGSRARGLGVAFAWGMLAVTDVVLTVAGFDRFYRLMSSWPTIRAKDERDRTARARRVCGMVNRARMFYPKRAWCLQSAAVAVCLLRIGGIAAELVIGVRKVPFYAHAWVEVEGDIVMNARTGLGTLFTVIARC